MKVINYAKIQNEGDKTLKLKKEDSACQGIFIKYFTTEDDETRKITRGFDY